MANEGTGRSTERRESQVQPVRQGGGVERSGSGRSPAAGQWNERRLPGLFGAWQEPFATMRQAVEEMDAIFEGLLGGRSGASARQAMPSVWAPQIEVTHKGDELLVRAALPGIRKEDVHVELSEGRLLIRGERQQSKESEEGGFHRSEFSYGQFYRELPLPDGCDVDSASATVKDGVLEVRVKTPQRSKGRRVEVTDATQPGAAGQVEADTRH